MKSLFDDDDDNPKHDYKQRGGEASDRAERLEGGWKLAALAQFKAYAQTHERFITEDAKLYVPDNADRRALGPIATEAARLGYVTEAGFRKDSTGAPKTLWQSRIYGRADA